MKTYKETFEQLKSRNEGALIPFTVIGDPDYKTSLQIAKTMADAGADMLELGLPFSDPIADGKTIQAADSRALASGNNTDKVFEFAKELREYTNIPIGFLTYYNLVYQRGIKMFYGDSKKCGINSILIADMPIEEYSCLSENPQDYGIDTVFMASPLTTNERASKIAKNTTGFIYVVSRLGVTGARRSLGQAPLSLIKRLRKFTEKPLCAGFGISKPNHIKSVIKAGADGAIVGSAIVSLIAKNIYNKEKMLHSISANVKEMKNATRIL